MSSKCKRSKKWWEKKISSDVVIKLDCTLPKKAQSSQKERNRWKSRKQLRIEGQRNISKARFPCLLACPHIYSSVWWRSIPSGPVCMCVCCRELRRGSYNKHTQTNKGESTSQESRRMRFYENYYLLIQENM